MSSPFCCPGMLTICPRQYNTILRADGMCMQSEDCCANEQRVVAGSVLNETMIWVTTTTLEKVTRTSRRRKCELRASIFGMPHVHTCHRKAGSTRLLSGVCLMLRPNTPWSAARAARYTSLRSEKQSRLILASFFRQNGENTLFERSIES